MIDSNIRGLHEDQERLLGPDAARSADSAGRRLPETPCSVRTEFMRDVGRILFSLDFRRMRNKTQVFFNPQNDHICTRMEHVITVHYIANTIGRSLQLNPDLIQAIAYGHDLGHAPFGHTGEKALDKALRAHDPMSSFKHELHSLRVIDELAAHKDDKGLNLTFEVRDGIACHCGEAYDEHLLIPDRKRRAEDLAEAARLHSAPATLEGCVVRMADKIAYVGRDVEDAVRAGIIESADIAEDLQSILGHTNGQIINTLVTDIITNSRGEDLIRLSEGKARALQQLLAENVRLIYRSEPVRRYEDRALSTIDGLFAGYLPFALDPERRAASKRRVIADFHQFLSEHPASAKASPGQQVVDYIAGMSDGYAERCFDALYWF